MSMMDASAKTELAAQLLDDAADQLERYTDEWHSVRQAAELVAATADLLASTLAAAHANPDGRATVEQAVGALQAVAAGADMADGVLVRDRDVSGVSGTGRVASWAMLADGAVVLWGWRCGGVEWFPSMQAAVDCHGHDGATRFTTTERSAQ